MKVSHQCHQGQHMGYVTFVDATVPLWILQYQHGTYSTDTFCFLPKVFLGKFRKCGHSPSQVAPQGCDMRLLRQGDVVMASIANKHDKERPGTSRLITLEPGSQSPIHWGTLSHDEIIGQPEGVLLPGAPGRLIYITRPTLPEYLEQVCGNTRFSSRVSN